MFLLAQDQPEYKENTGKEMTFLQRLAASKSNYAVGDMSDEELEVISNNFQHEAQQAAASEQRRRKNAATAHTIEQQFEAAGESALR